MTVDFVVAECAIRQLHAAFTDIAWRKDADGYAALFAPDGEWKIAGMHMRGREEIREKFALLLGACSHVHLMANAPQIEVDGDTAVSRVRVTEFARMNDGSTFITMGSYFDRYVKIDGQWLFQWRHFALAYRGPFAMPEDFVEQPDFGAFPGMPAPDAPTFTRRKA